MEKKACDDLSVIAFKASTDIEYTLTRMDKQLQLCETYSSSDDVIAGLIANKGIGTRPCVNYLVCI